MQSHGALEGERKFCPQCGHETTAEGLSSTPVLVRPAGITFLAGLQFFAAVISLIVLLAILSSEPKPLIVVLVGGMAALLAYCAYGLWTLKPQGRTIQLMFAWIGLAAFPAGTMMSIPVLYYLFRPSIRILFSGKSADQLSPEEAKTVPSRCNGSCGS